MKHPDATLLEQRLSKACPTTQHAAIIMALRDIVGVEKYGQTVDDNPLTAKEWIVHAMEEAADGLKYAIRAREEAEKLEQEVQALRTANAALAVKVSETQTALNLSARQLLETVNDRNSIGVQLDLLRDELMRIRARIGETGLIEEHPELSSIASYCERAQKDIAVSYTPIQERDKLQLEVRQLYDLLERAEEKVRELESWKESSLALEREWDPNQLATMLGGKLGESQRAVIQWKVPALVARVKRLEAAGDKMAAWLCSPRNLGCDPFTAGEWNEAKGQP